MNTSKIVRFANKNKSKKETKRKRKLSADQLAAGPSSTSLNKRRKQKQQQPTMRIRGVKVANNPDLITVTARYEDLTSAGYLIPATLDTPAKVSTLALGGMNITIREEVNKSYSLLDETINADLLDNDNIIDPKLKTLPNQLSDPSIDKFVDKTSPFYELDDGRSKFSKRKQKTLKKLIKPDVTKIAADMLKQNSALGSSSPNLPQFTKYT